MERTRGLFTLVVLAFSVALLIGCSPIQTGAGIQDASGKQIDLGSGVGMKVPAGWGGTILDGNSPAGRAWSQHDAGFRANREISLYSSLTDTDIGDSVDASLYVRPNDVAQVSSRFDHVVSRLTTETLIHPLPGSEASVTAFVRRSDNTHPDSYAVEVHLLAVKSPEWALTVGAGLRSSSPIVSEDDTQTVTNLLRYLGIAL